MTRPAAKEKTLWPALVAAAALLLTAPQAFASRTASTRPELLPGRALEPPATTAALGPAYVPQGFELQANTDLHPASFALFPEPAPVPERLEPEKLASGVASWELTPNLQRIQVFVAESWQVREKLGPVDSPNLYQAFGLDPQNNSDPYGLCVWGDWECWNWVAADVFSPARNLIYGASAAYAAYEGTTGFVQGVSGSVLPGFPGTAPSPGDSPVRRGGQILGASTAQAVGVGLELHGGGTAAGGGLVLVTSGGTAIPAVAPIAIGLAEASAGVLLAGNATSNLKKAESTSVQSSVSSSAASSGSPVEPTQRKKTRWDWIREWHDRRATELFGPGKGTGIGGSRWYDKSFRGRDIEYKSDNFLKWAGREDKFKAERVGAFFKQLRKDILYKDAGLANPHWHFEYDPRAIPEMKDFLKLMDEKKISWSYGHTTPAL